MKRIKYTLCMGVPSVIGYIGMKIIMHIPINGEALFYWMMEISPMWFGALTWDCIRYVRERANMRRAVTLMGEEVMNSSQQDIKQADGDDTERRHGGDADL